MSTVESALTSAASSAAAAASAASTSDDDDISGDDAFPDRYNPKHHSDNYDPANPSHDLLKKVLRAMCHPGYYGREIDVFETSVYHPETPESHAAARQLLDSLRGLPDEKLVLSYTQPCGCCSVGDRTELVSAVSAGADIRSLRYVLENNLLPPRFLCSVLAKMFRCSGSMISRPQQHYRDLEAAEGKDAVVHAIRTLHRRGMYDERDFHRAIADDNIKLLLDWLCEHHPEALRTWRETTTSKRESQYTPTLLHCVFYGHGDYDLILERFHKLVAVGCDPFAPYNAAAKMFETPWHLLGKHFMITEMKALGAKKSPDELRVLINIPSDPGSNSWDRNRNYLMQFLVSNEELKHPKYLRAMYDVIMYCVSCGIDLDYLDIEDRDRDGRLMGGCNIGDFINHGGYRTFLTEMSGDSTELKDSGLLAVVPTGKTVWSFNWKRVAKNGGIDTSKHNPSPLAALMYKHRRSKAPSEIAAFLTEWRRLTEGQRLPVSDWKYDDKGEFSSLDSLANSWRFTGLLLHHDLVPTWQEEKSWYRSKQIREYREGLFRYLSGARVRNGAGAVIVDAIVVREQLKYYGISAEEFIADFSGDDQFAPYIDALKALIASIAQLYRVVPLRLGHHQKQRLRRVRRMHRRR